MSDLARDSFEETTDAACVEQTPGLPFAFARRFGVVVTDADLGPGRLELVSRGQPPLTTLAEVKRHTRQKLLLRIVGEDEFEQVLTAAYARDASGARQMVEDLGDDLDLAALADSVPETEDLLEQSDDAPIIRLINALLTEAIRENASDIHVETFEKNLVVRFRVDGVMREVVRPKREQPEKGYTFVGWDAGGYGRDLPIRESYAHPGGAQAHGDMVAIAMEEPYDPSQGAAMYFARYKADVGDGQSEKLELGNTKLRITHAMADKYGMTRDAAAAAGFVKLANGYFLVAVAGDKDGFEGL